MMRLKDQSESEVHEGQSTRDNQTPRNLAPPWKTGDTLPPRRSVRCYIGLGSNLNDPVAQVTSALVRLGQISGSRLAGVSSLYRSKAVGPLNQPGFINAVAALDTFLPALQLLDALQRIETIHRRERCIHWGPRTLDLDLLMYGRETIRCERLTVPHPYLMWRDFVLFPLAEIAPEMMLKNNLRVGTHLAVSRMRRLPMIDAKKCFGENLELGKNSA